MIIRPIKNIVINEFVIDSKTSWADVIEVEPEYGILHKAFSLLNNSAYPNYLVDELDKEFGVHELTLTISNHNKFKNEKFHHPQWFTVLTLEQRRFVHHKQNSSVILQATAGIGKTNN